MKCPTCKDINLVMTSRDGVEIDYCPECRGIWLDRGELDKIIESANKNNNQNSGKNYDINQQDNNYKHTDNHHDNNHKYNDDKYQDKRYKKKSFLGDMFDF